MQGDWERGAGLPLHGISKHQTGQVLKLLNFVSYVGTRAFMSLFCDHGLVSNVCNPLIFIETYSWNNMNKMFLQRVWIERKQ